MAQLNLCLKFQSLRGEDLSQFYSHPINNTDLRMQTLKQVGDTKSYSQLPRLYRKRKISKKKKAIDQIEKLVTVKNINGVLCWVCVFLKDSKIHITVSPAKARDGSWVYIMKSPEHRNMKLIDFEEEIEKANISIEEEVDSCLGEH